MTTHEDSLFDDLLDDEGTDTSVSEFVPVDMEDDDDDSSSVPEDDFQITSMEDIQEDDEDENDDDSEDDVHSNQASIQENDLINEVLASKGIKNHTITYEDEEGNLVEEDFYSLPREEQIAILNSQEAELDLAEAEIGAVNFLRENGVTFEEAIDYFKREAVQEYIDSQNIAGIEVDQYTDEELFALDLKAKFEDLTDEEITIEINKQLEHPDLFKKKVDKLRTDYKEIEINQLQAAKASQESEEEERFTQLQNNLITVAESVEDIGGLDLDNNDKNEILSYILEKDINGVSPFIKSLDSPEKLFELAWYATKGKEAFGIIHDYYKKQIDSVRKTAYDKGRDEAAAKSKPSNDRKKFVRDQTVAKNDKTYLHIDNLEID